MARVGVFLITVALIAGMVGCDGYTPPSQNLEIRTWYDLDAVRGNLTGSYILMNDLDSTTLGYEELASPTANEGKGWQPIGAFNATFNGTFDGQGHEICDLFIDRPEEVPVGLFGVVDEGGHIENIGVVNAIVTANASVGGLVGWSYGTVGDSYSTGSVTGNSSVGGLVGWNTGTVGNSYSTGSVTGSVTGTGSAHELGGVGGLVGCNIMSSVSDSYSTSSVTGSSVVGGLVGWNEAGSVSNSYYTGSVTGNSSVGGLVGWNHGGTVSNSRSTGTVTGELGVGGLVGVNGDTVGDSYSTGSVTGCDYVGGLVGANSGIISNSYSTASASGHDKVGGLVGEMFGYGQEQATMSDSYATGSVTGHKYVGGLVGWNRYKSTVSNSYSTGSVTGTVSSGGLMVNRATVNNSFWDIETSGKATPDGGTGKTTAQMQDITTFSDAAWDIIAVANPDERNPSYAWNIVDDVTYPFLSWEP